MVDVAALLKRPTFILKFVELLFAIVCTAIVAGDIPVGKNLNEIAVVYVTLIGYMMINIICILSHIFEPPLNRLVLLIIAFSGFVMFLTAGAIMCALYTNYWKLDRLVASGVLSILCSFVYAGDTAATYFEQVA